jgi:hypothetical protein
MDDTSLEYPIVIVLIKEAFKIYIKSWYFDQSIYNITLLIIFMDEK